jgi:hypothetical protein
MIAGLHGRSIGRMPLPRATVSRAALVATLTTVVLWIADDCVLALGGDANGLLDSLLFLLGLVACLVASVLIGLAVFARRGRGRGAIGWRVLGVVLALVVVTGAGGLTQVVVSALEPAHPGWVYGELNLWVIMLVLLAAAASLTAREDTRDRDRGPRARVGAQPLS